ncbi:MAG: CPBP family glutamic-type intramembrane protease [Ferruginibacter sp.]
MNSTDALLKYALCFSMFFIIKWISKANRSNRIFDVNGALSANTANLIGLHLAGILWLGLVPVMLFKGSFNELITGGVRPELLWYSSFIPLVILLAVTVSRASRQITIGHNNIHMLPAKFLRHYFLVRILFLVFYELFFRGLLLFDCLKWFGAFEAVILTTLLTVLLHTFGDKKEMWACIPYGILAACCCISIHAVWPAIILHLSLSMVYEISLVNRFLTHLKLIK